eukprot:jgi/Botrbrau1/12810/Bobra.20_1s0001.1
MEGLPGSGTAFLSHFAAFSTKIAFWGYVKACTPRILPVKACSAALQMQASSEAGLRAEEEACLQLAESLEGGHCDFVEAVTEGKEAVTYGLEALTNGKGGLTDVLEALTNDQGGLTNEHEAEWRQEVEALLKRTGEALLEVAHLSPGELDRLLLEWALAFNLATLQNRRVPSLPPSLSTLPSLGAEGIWRSRQAHAEAECRVKEDAARARASETAFWEETWSRWRACKVRHLAACFAKRVSQGECGSPSLWNPMWASLRDSQSIQLQLLSDHLRRLPQLAGRSGTGAPVPQKVATWHQQLQQLAAEWDARRADTVAALQTLEAEHEAAAQAELQRLCVQVGHSLNYGARVWVPA